MNRLDKYVDLKVADPAEVGMSGSRLERVGPVMQSFLGENKVPGLVTLIARRGKVVHAEAQGYADVAMGRKLKIHDIFRIYSMAKPVTAVAVMLLYEEGRFFLDDAIANYLPEFKQMKVHTMEGVVDAERPITIRHLLTHSSGLTYSMVPDQPAVSRLYQIENVNEAFSRLSGRTLENHVKLLADFPLISQPGSEWHYSEGMCVLARLVEVLSGQSYGEFLQQQIFEPLNMVDTGFYVPQDKLDRLVTLYEQCADRRGYSTTKDYGGDYSQCPPLEPGGSGLVSTIVDYLNFAQMLLNGGELNGTRLLSPTTVQLLMSDQFGGDFCDYSTKSFFSGFNGIGFGFGGYVVTDPMVSGRSGSVGEYGWGGWANTRFWVDPREQLIGMVFAQIIPVRGVDLRLVDRLRQMTYQAVIDN